MQNMQTGPNELPKSDSINQADLFAQIKLLNSLLVKHQMSLLWYKIFFRGVLSGLGATIGLGIIIWIFLKITSQFDFLPGVHNFVDNLKFLIE